MLQEHNHYGGQLRAPPTYGSVVAKDVQEGQDPTGRYLTQKQLRGRDLASLIRALLSLRHSVLQGTHTQEEEREKKMEEWLQLKMKEQNQQKELAASDLEERIAGRVGCLLGFFASFYGYFVFGLTSAC